MSSDRRRSLVPPVLIFTLLALPLLVIFGYFVGVSVSLYTSGTRVQGHVVSTEHYRYRGGSGTNRHTSEGYTVTVEYTDRYGVRHRTTYDNGSDVAVGTAKTVSYNPADPREAIVVGDRGTYVMRPGVFAIATAVAIGWGLSSLVRRRGHNRRLAESAAQPGVAADPRDLPYWMRDGDGRGRE